MIRRGQVHKVFLPDVEDEKTALIVSSNVVSDYLKPVVVQVTSSDRDRSLPTFVRLSAGEGGLDRDSFALCHAIHTLSQGDVDPNPLGDPIPMPRMVEVEDAIARALDLRSRAA